MIATGENCINPRIDLYQDDFINIDNNDIDCSGFEEVLIVGDSIEKSQEHFSEETKKSILSGINNERALNLKKGRNENGIDSSDSFLVEENSREWGPKMCSSNNSAVESTSNVNNILPVEKEPHLQSVANKEISTRDKSFQKTISNLNNTVSEMRSYVNNNEASTNLISTLDIKESKPILILNANNAASSLFEKTVSSDLVSQKSEGEQVILNIDSDISILCGDKNGSPHSEPSKLQEVKISELKDNTNFGYSSHINKESSKENLDEHAQLEVPTILEIKETKRNIKTKSSNQDNEKDLYKYNSKRKNFEIDKENILEIEVPKDDEAESISINFINSFNKTSFYNECQSIDKSKAVIKKKNKAKHMSQNKCSHCLYDKNEKIMKSNKTKMASSHNYAWDIDMQYQKFGSECCYECGVGNEMEKNTQFNQKARYIDAWSSEDDWDEIGDFPIEMSPCNTWNTYQGLGTGDSRQKNKYHDAAWNNDEEWEETGRYNPKKREHHCNKWGYDEWELSGESNQKSKCQYDIWANDNDWDTKVKCNKGAICKTLGIYDKEKSVGPCHKSESVRESWKRDCQRINQNMEPTCSTWCNNHKNWEEAENCPDCIQSIGVLDQAEGVHVKQSWKGDVTKCKTGYCQGCFSQPITPNWDHAQSKALRNPKQHAEMQDMYDSQDGHCIGYSVEAGEENWVEMPYEPGYYNQYDASYLEYEWDDDFYDWDEGSDFGEENYNHNYVEEDNPAPLPVVEEQWDLLQQLLEEDMMLEMRAQWLLSRRYG